MKDEYTIRYLKLAQDDLREIMAYLSQFYPSTSQSFIDKLRKQIHLLKRMPLMCEVYYSDPFYRKMIVGDYLVFYHVNSENHVIEIHRILHGTQNVKRYL